MVRTIVPLRIIGIISIVFFIAYGALAGAVATFLLYLLSLPINIIRLRQMLNLVKKARVSAQGDLSMDWLRPFMTPRKYKKGDVLFRQGRCRQGDVLHGQRKVPGEGDRRRASARPHHGRARLHRSEQPADRDGRKPRERRGADHHLRQAAGAVFPESRIRLLLPAPHHRAPDAEHLASRSERRRATRRSCCSAARPPPKGSS